MLICNKCSSIIGAGNKFCGKCGETVNQIINLNTENSTAEKINFVVIPTWRIIFFGILSFGFYSIYWFTKNFKAISKERKLRGEPISPVFWGIFNNLGSSILFKEIDILNRKKYGKGLVLSPISLGVTYFIMVLFLTPLVSIFVILILQKVFKKYSKDQLCTFSELKFSWKEIAVTILGIIIMIISVVYNLSQETILTPSEKSELIIEAVQEIKSSTSLPSQLDEFTLLTDVSAHNDSIRYNYTLSGIDTDNLSNSYLKELLVPDLCANPKTKLVLNQDIGMEYSYLIKDSTQNYFVSITKADCL